MELRALNGPSLPLTLRQLRPSVEHVFLIDSFITILGANPEAELRISAKYERQGRVEADSIVFYLADYANTLIIKPPLAKAMDALGKKVDGITHTLERIHHDISLLERIADGSGLRLSHRTIQALAGQDQRFDPNEFDWKGYSVILDITMEQAIKLDRIFRGIGGGSKLIDQYNEIPAEIREKFERVFKVDIVRKENSPPN